MAISKDMSEATEVTLPRVRAILKKAGLTPAKYNVSSNVRRTHGMGGNYRTCVTQGFALKNQTEYRMKKHVRTGRVEVELNLSSWHADAQQAAADLATAKQALTDAGYTVSDAHALQIVVSR